MKPIRLGVICGTGADSIELGNITRHIKYNGLTQGTIGNLEVITLPRFHGNTPPHRVDHKANISRLEFEGADYIISLTAVGSLKKRIEPGKLVLPLDVADFTGYSGSTINEIVHPTTSDIISSKLRSAMVMAAVPLGEKVAVCDTCVSIKGPRFNTRAESRYYASFDHFDVVNMTTAPEASLCLEWGIPYAILGYVTDYDSGVNVSAGLPGSVNWATPSTYTAIKNRAQDIQPTVNQLLRDVAERLSSWGHGVDKLV